LEEPATPDLDREIEELKKEIIFLEQSLTNEKYLFILMTEELLGLHRPLVEINQRYKTYLQEAPPMKPKKEFSSIKPKLKESTETYVKTH